MSCRRDWTYTIIIASLAFTRKWGRGGGAWAKHTGFLFPSKRGASYTQSKGQGCSLFSGTQCNEHFHLLRLGLSAFVFSLND